MASIMHRIYSVALAIAAAFGTSVFLGMPTAGYAKTPQSVGNRHVIHVPVGLENDIKFWERVFSSVSPDQCLFHDSWNLDVVYAVEKVPKSGSRNRMKNIQTRKHLIRSALSRFEKGTKPTNKFERRIYDAIPPKHRTAAFFAAAKGRVRCQRGVDLRPSLARSQKYLGMIRSELQKKKLPADLAYLPHLESGFNVRAHSRAGAKGIWQFTRSAAQFSKLRVVKGQKGNFSVDERLDPWKSTRAAAIHLAEIFESSGSWPLAITAYNYGHNGVARAVKKFGPDYLKIRIHHKTRIFGFAARNYFPSFIAVRNVAKRFESERREQSRKSVTLASTGGKAGAL